VDACLLYRVNHPPSSFLYSLSLHDALPILAYGVAQADPNPNSPTPVLIAEPGSSRVRAVREGFHKRTRVIETAFPPNAAIKIYRSEEHTSELQSRENLVCRLLLEK